MDITLKKRYNLWQWRTLIILMIGYALFYFVRKNFSIAMPALKSELGLDETQLGIFLTLNGIIYGISRFINGFISDRAKSKKLIMGLGLLLSAVVNVLIGLSPQMNGLFHLLDDGGKATVGMVYFIGSLWLINGFTQGMGYPPCGSLMAHWIRPSELATKQSIWNSSHSIGAGLVAVLIGTFILGRFGYEAWQWCFFIPAMLAAAGSLLLFFGLKDSPASVGLPSPEEIDEMDEAAPVKLDVPKESPEKAKKIYNALLKKMVFRNPIIWILAVSNFCVYVIRFTILDWGSMFLTDYKHMDIALAANVVAASEIVGGIIGTLLAGWVTDKFFKSKAHHTCFIFMIMATLCFFIFWRLPQSDKGLAIVFLILSSFFIYGPQALTGIAASNQATKRAAASANGILGIFGYASTAVSGLVFGMIAKTFGWNTVFAVAIAFGILGCLVFALMWKAPADGYAKTEKIIAEVEAGTDD
ncbi:MAG: MFS transporter [Bacteroidales bacterium]|nr:MFS transporter [Bacteroidales bacterium]